MSNAINTNQFASQLQNVNNTFANFANVGNANAKPNATTYAYEEGKDAKPLKGKDAMANFMNDLFNAGSNRVTRFG